MTGRRGPKPFDPDRVPRPLTPLTNKLLDAWLVILDGAPERNKARSARRLPKRPLGRGGV